MERPLAEAIASVAVFPWDWTGEPLGLVWRVDLQSALVRLAAGQITSEQVEQWADALKCRDDVDFEGDEVQQAIFELANPNIHGANSLDQIVAKFIG